MTTPKPPRATAETTAPKQRGVPFEPGQSGNPKGRPKGSRHKLSEEFLSALCADFAEHGKGVIETVRQSNPVAYLKVIAMTLPRQVDLNANPFDDMSDADLDAAIREVVAVLRQDEADEPGDAFEPVADPPLTP